MASMIKSMHIKRNDFQCKPRDITICINTCHVYLDKEHTGALSSNVPVKIVVSMSVSALETKFDGARVGSSELAAAATFSQFFG